MEVKFRIAKENDIEGIIKLCNECFYEETPLSYATKIYNETKDDKNQIYVVGEANGQIIAHVKVTIIPTIYQKMNTYAILNHVCVKPEFRRHNIASKMLDVAKEICTQNNCVKIELWSNNSRQPAHACYKNYGFVVDDAKFFSFDIQK